MKSQPCHYQTRAMYLVLPWSGEHLLICAVERKELFHYNSDYTLVKTSLPISLRHPDSEIESKWENPFSIWGEHWPPGR